ncbi:winged helix-turn-helix transcriptional regulator [Halobaculum sp. MBLA0147]|uniref:winged helix-turn-helix transcriptional regulator n=1 Tax=Halobaculum sp. MBLA0147 TaxID=3079934 RepID=UPI003523C0C4
MVFESVRELVAPKRTLEVLQLLAEDGPLRFGELEDSVDTSSDTLTQSLTTLVEYDLIDREERNRRNVSYRVTEFGGDVLSQVRSLETDLEPDETPSDDGL